MLKYISLFFDMKAFFKPSKTYVIGSDVLYMSKTSGRITYVDPWIWSVSLLIRIGFDDGEMDNRSRTR